MSNSNKRPPGDPMMLGNMRRRLGVQRLVATASTMRADTRA
jgi:hypothetical protein